MLNRFMLRVMITMDVNTQATRISAHRMQLHLEKLFKVNVRSFVDFG